MKGDSLLIKALALATIACLSTAMAQAQSGPAAVLEGTPWKVNECYAESGARRPCVKSENDPEDFPLAGNWINLFRLDYPGAAFVLVKPQSTRGHAFNAEIHSSGTKPIQANGKGHEVPFLRAEFFAANGALKQLELHLVHTPGNSPDLCQALLDEIVGNSQLTCSPVEDRPVVHWSISTLSEPNGNSIASSGGEDEGDDDDDEDDGVSILTPPGDSQGTGSGEG